MLDQFGPARANEVGHHQGIAVHRSDHEIEVGARIDRLFSALGRAGEDRFDLSGSLDQRSLGPVALGTLAGDDQCSEEEAAPLAAEVVVALLWLITLIIISGIAVLTFWVDPPYFAHEIGYGRTPFQFEVSGANLAAVIDLLVSLRVRSWRLPAVAFYGIYLCVAAGGHIYQWFFDGDHAAGNGVATWITDVVPQLVIFVVLLTGDRADRREVTDARPA